MKRYLISLFVLCALPLPALALNIFACEPEWGSLATELGGDQVKVYVATNAHQDPHHVQARPGLINRVRRADMVACTGGELEIGWLPVLLEHGGNNKVRKEPGLFYADSQIQLLGKPTTLDRAAGDIHADGNPHAQLGPHRMLKVANAMSARLQQLDPEHSADYQQRLASFSQRWQAAIARWQQQAKPLQGMPVIVHHEEWIYLLNFLGMTRVGELEPKPGLPPTPSHLAELVNVVKDKHAQLIIYSAYNSPDASHWLASHTGACAVQLPFTVGGTDKAKDLFSLMDDSIQRLLDTREKCHA
ncbi:MAG: zinc ABC transporter substrate-binding protein [Alcanivorax sp.]|nr:zinc ABC transporter substrate-binding protein [Alcanivorax sp.]